MTPLTKEAFQMASTREEKVRLTPKMAAEMWDKTQEVLAENPGIGNYRQFDTRTAGRYSRLMKAGRWKYNGIPILIGTKGNITDGQHRVWAVIDSDVTITVLVVYGIDDVDDVDRGKPRTLADMLRRNGEKYVSLTRGTLTWVNAYNIYSREIEDVMETARRSADTIVEYIELLDKNPGIREAVKFTAGKKPDIKVLDSSWSSALTYLIRRTRNEYAEEYADQFIHAVRNGTNLQRSDARFVFRRYLIRESAKPQFRRFHPLNNLAIGVKAWNNYILDKQTTVLVWRQTGTGGEEFPLIEGFQRFRNERR